jgi:hypothetical protein
MAAEAPHHTHLVGKEDEALGFELFAKLGGHVAQLGQVAEKPKHRPTLAQRGVSPHEFAERPAYCTVTIAEY